MPTIPHPYNDFPKLLTSPDSNPKAVDFLKEGHAYEAYKNGVLKVKYAPKEDRLLFYNKKEDRAYGRYMSELRTTRRLWKEFGLPHNLEKFFFVGSGNIVVIVKDIRTACAVGSLPYCTGCARSFGGGNPPYDSDGFSRFSLVLVDTDSSRLHDSRQEFEKLRIEPKLVSIYLGSNPTVDEIRITIDKVMEMEGSIKE